MIFSIRIPRGISFFPANFRAGLFILSAFLAFPALPTFSTLPTLPSLSSTLSAAPVAPAPQGKAAKKPVGELGSPRSAVRFFIDSCREGKYVRASRVLDLRSISAKNRKEKGAELARRLKLVLDQKIWFDFETISDDPAGNPRDGRNLETIGVIRLKGKDISLRLIRTRGKWRFSQATVAAVPDLYRAYGLGFIESRLPRALRETRFWEMKAWQWLGLPLILFLCLIASGIVNLILARIFTRIVKKTAFKWDDRLLRLAHRPAVVFLAVLIFGFLLKFLRLSVPAQELMNGILQTFLILAVVWMLLRFTEFIALTLRNSLMQGLDDDLKRRGVHTQVVVIRRIINIILIVIGAALILIQFDVVRKVGMSLLASAGIAGVVLGLAAQKSIASILAGVQLAVTQPVRIGDTVIVEGEWGWIEEINLTYVVVKVWDLRRLVVPISSFLDKSFENWTKVSPDLLGTIFVYADYTVPVQKVREAFLEFVKGNKLWDGVAAGLLVTNTNDRSIELRGLISAADAGAQWDLRCEAREFLVRYLQELDGGAYLPKTRRTYSD